MTQNCGSCKRFKSIGGKYGDCNAAIPKSTWCKEDSEHDLSKVVMKINEGSDCPAWVSKEEIDNSDLRAAMELVASDEAFFNHIGPNKELSLLLLVNDVFAWGCADAEPIPFSKAKEVLALMENDEFAIPRYVQKIRNGLAFQGPFQKMVDEYDSKKVKEREE